MRSSDIILALKGEKTMNNSLTLGRIDFGPLHRFTVGFDEVLNELNRLGSHGNQDSSYPPYNIIKHDDDNFTIELAVAGFDQSEIDISVENNQLKISGTQSKRDAEAKTSEFLHRGISGRDFNKTFTLGSYIKVNGADLKNGVLTVTLERVVPEALKPRKIAITATV
jgi:molecular chaperone IbpA